jgi:hypothetical protein
LEWRSFISSVFNRLNNKQICLNTGQSYTKIAVTQNVTAIDLEDVGEVCLKQELALIKG